ncbi:hypothetical protein M1446_02795 [Candidatus Dependentiae bacterium]|nr:hypothetical protein [Candidatus Dependentiae bacterium]
MCKKFFLIQFFFLFSNIISMDSDLHSDKRWSDIKDLLIEIKNLKKNNNILAMSSFENIIENDASASLPSMLNNIKKLFAQKNKIVNFISHNKEIILRKIAFEFNKVYHSEEDIMKLWSLYEFVEDNFLLNEDVIQILLYLSNPNKKVNCDYTPLMIIARARNLADFKPVDAKLKIHVIQLLLNNGAKINTMTDNGHTALDFASPKAVRDFMISKGAMTGDELKKLNY